jgi:hypothetical protein
LFVCLFVQRKPSRKPTVSNVNKMNGVLPRVFVTISVSITNSLPIFLYHASFQFILIYSANPVESLLGTPLRSQLLHLITINATMINITFGLITGKIAIGLQKIICVTISTKENILVENTVTEAVDIVIFNLRCVI